MMKNRPKPLYIYNNNNYNNRHDFNIDIYREKKSCCLVDNHYKENTTIDNIYEVDCTIFLILGLLCCVQAWKVVSVT